MTVQNIERSGSDSNIPGDWQEIARLKQAKRAALIPAEWLIRPTDAANVIDVPRTCGLLSEEEIHITETPADELIASMVEGKLKSREVTVAFCKRAAIAQQLTNCLTEILFDAAIKAAEELDHLFAQSGQAAGPLHGLPISMKDNFYIEGVDTTVGFVGWSNDPATKEQESTMTRTMRESGAILFCKTNVPTAMMMPESYNNCWGYTSNPFNRNLTCGGSSGGEGALLALRGSPLGVGTDIGGSIRIPAALCSLYSLKPSFGRFATYAARSGLPGQEAVKSINGPMSTHLGAIELWAKAVVDSKGWETDPNVLPIPWREVTLPEKLCFGLISDNDMVRPTPPVLRALREVKQALEAAGHIVIEWKSYKPVESADLLENFFVGDGGVKIKGLLDLTGEPYPRQLQKYGAAYERSKDTPPLVGDLWTTQSKRTAFAKGALDKWMATKKLTGTGRPFDGVISPATPFSAPPRYTFEHYHYTSTWNITDQSCTTFPVTFVDQDRDRKGEYEARNEAETRIWERYDPVEVAGAPVSLQLVAQRLEEEKVLALTRIVKDALEKRSI